MTEKDLLPTLQWQSINTELAQRVGLRCALVFNYVALQVLTNTRVEDSEGFRLWDGEAWWTNRTPEQIARATGEIVSVSLVEGALEALCIGGYLQRGTLKTAQQKTCTGYTLTKGGCRYAKALDADVWQQLHTPPEEGQPE